MLVWDVNKLVEKSKSLPVFDLPLSQIKEFNKNYWYQDDDDKPTCESIANHMKLVLECDLSYPIILAPDGRVMDGMHRVCKAYLNGQATLKATKFKNTPEPDFVNISLDELPYD